MQVDVLSIKGKKTGRTVELPEEIFGIEPNQHVVYLAVKQYLAAQRQGTHKVKTRAEVQGASRKLHRQKGTGGSRKGNIRNPLYKGGGTVFGPKPHGYDIKLNRKVKDLAKMSALSAKAKDNAIVVVEDIELDTPKTKSFMDIMGTLTEGRKILFVMPEYNDNVYRSYRNVPSVNGTLLSDMNTYDLVNADVLVMTEGVAKIFNEEDGEEVAVEAKPKKEVKAKAETKVKAKAKTETKAKAKGKTDKKGKK
jgi:large subunit ribosomal protein L4